MDLTEKITEIKFKWLKFVVHGDKIDVADGYSGGAILRKSTSRETINPRIWA